MTTTCKKQERIDAFLQPLRNNLAMHKGERHPVASSRFRLLNLLINSTEMQTVWPVLHRASVEPLAFVTDIETAVRSAHRDANDAATDAKHTQSAQTVLTAIEGLELAFKASTFPKQTGYWGTLETNGHAPVPVTLGWRDDMKDVHPFPGAPCVSVAGVLGACKSLAQSLAHSRAAPIMQRLKTKDSEITAFVRHLGYLLHSSHRRYFYSVLAHTVNAVYELAKRNEASSPAVDHTWSTEDAKDALKGIATAYRDSLSRGDKSTVKRLEPSSTKQHK